MKKLLTASFTTLALATAGNAFAADITGAGATFPYPLYAKWADAYKKQTGIGLNYQSIGSGGGIKQIKAKTVVFGASDKPLTPEELAKDGLTQFPTVMGGVVPAINVPGVADKQLKLTAKLIADIFLGKITKWNDAQLLAANPGVKLPDMVITVVHRSDGSGTTFLFTDYLSKVSPEWKQKVGAEASVKWPTGVGGKGNEGVSSYVMRVPGAIGYVEYSYALQNKMAVAQLQNREGAFVTPSDDTFKAAAASAKWSSADSFYQILTDQPGKTSWPITGATFILMHKKADNADASREAFKFFDWAYTNGDKMADELHYVPIPDNVKKIIRDSWKADFKDASGQPVWK